MKNIYLLLFTFFSITSQAQIINFPDANFKNALVNTLCVDTNNTGGGDIDADTNNDGEIEVSEAIAVQRLFVNNQNITDLTGIANFTNLTNLFCSNNQLTFFNGEGLSNLIDLNCSSNPITDGTFNLLTSLSGIAITNTLITELDLSSTRATSINCSSNPNLVFLNMKNGVISTCLMLLPEIPCVYYANTSMSHICVDEEELALMSGGISNSFINTYCALTTNPNLNIINGTAQFDCNNTQIPVPNLPVNIATNFMPITTLTDASGNYSRYVGQGSYTITPVIQNFSYFTVTPATVSTNFATTGNTFSADFCLTANGVHPDLEVTLLPITPARAGFNATYKLIVKNIGTEIQTGNVSLTFNDGLTDFVSANPTVGSQAANSLSWNFTNLNPLQTQEIQFVLHLNAPIDTPPLNSGDILNFVAQLSSQLTDETPENNQFNLNQLVVNSFDPNDKTCLEGAQIAVSSIDNYLHYLVRFQNTGTADAVNVVISDNIQNKLNATTLEIESASHSYRATMLNDQLSVYFDNINLPPSATDEPGSHGYVAFKIKPKSNVVLNDVIENTANIYFDYNFPIVTNTVSTTVVNLGTNDFDQNTFTIYPNPTSGMLNLVLSPQTIVKAGFIYNMVGQKVVTFDTVATDVSFLPQGTYFITLETDKGKATKPFVKL
jgi:uncharacterized repeat protein (TIGR01451 family)